MGLSLQVPAKPANKILLIGEAPGATEVLYQKPFVGYSGKELSRMLADAHIDRDACYLTNVFSERPPGNSIAEFCGKKAEVGPGYSLPPLSPGHYVLPKYLPELDRLQEEIRLAAPNVIVLLGNTACWAVLRQTGISRLRGAVGMAMPGHSGPTKAIPTYHPAAVCRQWGLRPVVIMDLMKAAREARSPELHIPTRTIIVPETIDELRAEVTRLLESATRISFDIETKQRQITCIAFSAHPHRSLVVPLATRISPFRYWTDEADEIAARQEIKKILASPIPKLGQNGVYDIQYCWTEGMPVRNYADDTMLLHHSIYPELPKGLGFLGSIYTNAPAWKEFNPKGNERKADD